MPAISLPMPSPYKPRIYIDDSVFELPPMLQPFIRLCDSKKSPPVHTIDDVMDDKSDQNDVF